MFLSRLKIFGDNNGNLPPSHQKCSVTTKEMFLSCIKNIQNYLVTTVEMFLSCIKNICYEQWKCSSLASKMFCDNNGNLPVLLQNIR